MKTTLILDDYLHREAKQKAIELGISFTRFVEEALRLRLNQVKLIKSKIIKPLPTLKGGGLQSGIDWDEMDNV